MFCKKDENNVYQIKTSRPAQRRYNVIGVIEGDDVEMSVPINNDNWVNNGYNLTIYNEETRETYSSVSLTEDPQTIKIDDFSFDQGKALLVVEDRSDINNIETVETITYLFFKVFEGGTTATTQEGFINYTEADDNTISIPYYTTSFTV